jgi:hypothetical protein
MPIKRRSEIGSHSGPLAVVQLIAVGAWPAGGVAALAMPTSPRFIGMVLAHPAGVLRGLAFDHRPNMGTPHTTRQRGAEP